MAKNKPRNLWTVVTVERINGRFTSTALPAVSTEAKAREVLEGLGVGGFIKHNGETMWQYSMGVGKIIPPRWIDRRV